MSHRERQSIDVLLVGAGPAGIAAALHFRQTGLTVMHVEEGELAQTIRRFPTGVRLFSTRENLALPGFPFGPDSDASPTREEYISYLEESVTAAGLRVETKTAAVATGTRPGGYLFDIISSDGTQRTVEARNVVVASGGYFFPNILGISGEDQSHVHHYFQNDVISREGQFLVVGGRNSAVEAAVNIAEAGASATLVYRKSRLPRSKIKPWLLPRLDAQLRTGRVRIRYRSVPREITPEGVLLYDANGSSSIESADTVFLLTGYGPDYRLLRALEVRFHKQTARPLFNQATLETRTPGVFVCGTVALQRYREQVTIENSRDHALHMLDSIRTRCDAG